MVDRVNAKNGLTSREKLNAIRPDTVPLGDEPSNAGWEAYLDLDEAMSDADWTCRSGVRERLLPLVAERLDGFAAEHQGQINTMRKQWQSIETRARGLGWTPESTDFAPHLQAPLGQ